ncbi:uncharacterized protein PG998_002789 [Apiospora kogelbergensis]|uniref:uncharacterized protein n=1 Tax=Apiospora kogelbergensis TaxID=1337665 RepID=UPI003130FEFC
MDMYPGNTALHYVTMLQSADLVELLLARGADPNRKNTAEGRPPFFNRLAPHNLDLWKARDLVRQLLARGLGSDRPSGKQQLPLHIAANCLAGWNNTLGFGGFRDALPAQDDMMRMPQQDTGGAGGDGDSNGDDVDMMQVPDEAGVTPRQALAGAEKERRQVNYRYILIKLI